MTPSVRCDCQRETRARLSGVLSCSVCLRPLSVFQLNGQGLEPMRIPDLHTRVSGEAEMPRLSYEYFPTPSAGVGPERAMPLVGLMGPQFSSILFFIISGIFF